MNTFSASLMNFAHAGTALPAAFNSDLAAQPAVIGNIVDDSSRQSDSRSRSRSSRKRKHHRHHHRHHHHKKHKHRSSHRRTKKRRRQESSDSHSDEREEGELSESPPEETEEVEYGAAGAMFPPVAHPHAHPTNGHGHYPVQPQGYPHAAGPQIFYDNSIRHQQQHQFRVSPPYSSEFPGIPPLLGDAVCPVPAMYPPPLPFPSPPSFSQPTSGFPRPSAAPAGPSSAAHTVRQAAPAAQGPRMQMMAKMMTQMQEMYQQKLQQQQQQKQQMMSSVLQQQMQAFMAKFKEYQSKKATAESEAPAEETTGPSSEPIKSENSSAVQPSTTESAVTEGEEEEIVGEWKEEAAFSEDDAITAEDLEAFMNYDSDKDSDQEKQEEDIKPEVNIKEEPGDDDLTPMEAQLAASIREKLQQVTYERESSTPVQDEPMHPQDTYVDSGDHNNEQELYYDELTKVQKRKAKKQAQYERNKTFKSGNFHAIREILQVEEDRARYVNLLGGDAVTVQKGQIGPRLPSKRQLKRDREAIQREKELAALEAAEEEQQSLSRPLSATASPVTSTPEDVERCRST